MEVDTQKVAEIRAQLKEEYEKSRKATLIGYAVNGGTIVVGILVMLSSMGGRNSHDPFNGYRSPGMDPFGMFFMILLIAGVLILVNKVFITPHKENYALKVKEAINNYVFKALFEDVSFMPHSGMEERSLRDIGLIDLGNRYTTNDLLTGNYKGVDFARADVCAETETTDSEGHTHRSTDFKGQTYRFNFHKDTHHYVRIRDRGFFNGFSRGRKIDNSKKITFEDQQFNDMFNTYANDQEEAFYIFTPHFMERIKRLRNQLGYSISLVVKDSMLYLAIYSKTDSYELSSLSEVSNEYIQMVINESKVIQFVIDELGLDSTLFKN